MSSYQEPEWAVKPSSSSTDDSSTTSSYPPWTLTEIKSGVEVAKHDLSNRATTILGRAVDVVHVPLHHESISRQHARLSFDGNGNAWLKDLQSAHGTFVNKRRLPPRACGKVESKLNEPSLSQQQKGARGVLVFSGDVLKLGASSRYFSLEGGAPRTSDRERERSKKDKLDRKSEKWQQQEKQHQLVRVATNADASADANPSEEGGISWGISMEDDYNDRGDDSSSEKADCNGNSNSNKSITIASLLEDPSRVPEKYRKELDKINAMKFKLSNLETEDQRIRRKGGELTEGQEKQLQKNAEKEAILRRSLRERGESLCDKIDGRSGGRQRKTTARENNNANYDEDEDDFFDRTKRNNNNKIGDTTTTMGNSSSIVQEEAESEETLTEKWKNAFRERTHLTKVVLPKARNCVDALRERLRVLGNDEEAFFVQNDLKLALEARQKAEWSLGNNTTPTMDGIETLLRVVNPKLYCDRETGYIGVGRPRPSQQESPSPSSSSFKPGSTGIVSIKDTTIKDESSSSTAMQPPPSMLPPPPKPSKNTSSMPPPPLMQTNASVSTIKTATATEFTVTMPPPPNKNKRKRIIGPAAGPPPSAADQAASQQKQPLSTTATTKRKRVIGTLAFLNHATATTSTSTSEANANANDANKTMQGKQQRSSSVPRQQQKQQQQQLLIDTQSDVWRAPEGQDGSGRTKLNKKFDGRY